MRERILPLEFFRRPVLEVAPELLGKYLVLGEQKLIITEVEAYDGPDDKASHASRGKTKRNEVMFEKGGVWYVYLCYGLHWMLNIVTGEKDYPSAVLIRGACRVASASELYAVELNGPGKLTKHFQIDKRFNALPASAASGLYIAENENVRHLVSHSSRIITAPRVGVAYAGPVWSQKPWRFILKTRV